MLHQLHTAGADETWMRHALQVAQRGTPAPNPHVGAVIVHDGRLIAVGHHERAGQAHAEVAALRGSAAPIPAGATLYVTLEPCNHHGRTPPCTAAIIAADFARVVVGTRDPNLSVAGGGVECLRAAGIEVCVGVLEAEARALIATWARAQARSVTHLASHHDSQLSSANLQSHRS